MTVFYTRVSTVLQNSARQSENIKDDWKLMEDKCSGTIPFFERPCGKKIKELSEKGQLTELIVHQIDRLGRNLDDILQTISFFTRNKINVIVRQQNLETLNADMSENDISKMIISILGTVAEMERKMIRERQLEGIAIAKANGKYKNQNTRSAESISTFLSKPKVQEAMKLLGKGIKSVQVARAVKLHPNTITKIKKLNQKNNSNEKA
jgi:DNA invertase Pin-like site-specific DNA recombinase